MNMRVRKSKNRNRTGKKKLRFSTKNIFLALLAVCFIAIFLSLTFNVNGGPLKSASDCIFGPMQRGINHIGKGLNTRKEELKKLRDVMRENEQLQKKIRHAYNKNKSDKVKPNYKKKVSKAIKRVKEKHRMKVVRTNIAKKGGNARDFHQD